MLFLQIFIDMDIAVRSNWKFAVFALSLSLGTPLVTAQWVVTYQYPGPVCSGSPLTVFVEANVCHASINSPFFVYATCNGNSSLLWSCITPDCLLVWLFLVAPSSAVSQCTAQVATGVCQSEWLGFMSVQNYCVTVRPLLALTQAMIMVIADASADLWDRHRIVVCSGLSFAVLDL